MGFWAAKIRGVSRLAVILALAAALSCIAASWLASEPIRLSTAFAILSLLALLAELWPVVIGRSEVRITFTLPFLAGLVLLPGGAKNAILVDTLITLIAGTSVCLSARRPVSWLWIAVNASVAALSSSLAGLAWIAVDGKHTEIGIGLAVAIALFVAVYAVSNFALVAFVERVASPRGYDSVMRSWRPNAQATLLYALVAILVGLLVRIECAHFAVLTILPLAAVRFAIKTQARMYEQYFETISALSIMLQRVHPYTLGHLRRVAAIAEDVALRLGLSGKRARLVHEAAILHDIGKIAINERVLDKPGRLTPEEFDHVRQHAAFGARILAPVEALRPIVPWIKHHHERPDGTGYPDRLLDGEIPIESKIIAVVDAYDAMTGGDGQDPRTYREPLSAGEALDELERCAGSQFDAKVVAAFKQVVLKEAR